MPRVPIQIGKQSAEAFSAPVSIEKLTNAYVEVVPEGREPTPVYGTPGLDLFATAGSGPVRGMKTIKDVLYVVSGTSLYSVNSSGTVTSLGSIPGSDLVDMEGDATYVVVVAGNEIYVYDTVGAALTTVTDANVPASGASAVALINGFYVFSQTNSERFFISPQNDPRGSPPSTAYDASDFNSADKRSDLLVRPHIQDRDLLLFGEETTELWYYSGDATFPFSRYTTGHLDVGIAGKLCSTSSNETVFWLASDLTVRRRDGNIPTRVSNHAVEREIESWTDASTSVVSNHVWDGHLFIVIRNDDGCVVFDQATNTWHYRKSYNQNSWRCRCFAEAYGKKLFGSATDGKIYTLNSATYTENGTYLEFEMITPWVDAGGLRMFVDELETRLESGVGSLTKDPQLTCERTEDGLNWTPRQSRGYGKVGERFARVLFGRQGVSRGCAFRLRTTENTKRVIYGAYADIDVEVA